MKISSFRTMLVALLALVGLAMAPAQVSAAALINGLLQSGENQFQDSDQERFVRCPGTLVDGVCQDTTGATIPITSWTPVTSGDILVGDVIQTILRFTDANSLVISDEAGFGSPYQLVAYAELLVADINTTGLTADQITAGFVNLVFAPSGNIGDNVFAEIYERTTAVDGYNATIAPQDAIDDIRALTLIAEIGIGDTDDFWFATTLEDLTAASTAIAGSPQQANGVAGLSFVTNAGMLPYLTDGIQSGTTGTWHDVVLSASAYVRDTNANAGWLVSSNTEARFNIPEPGSLALLGLGLLGLGFARRRTA